MTAKKMIVLFDESGTPAISDDPRTDWFLGVGVVYEQSDEEVIFSKCKADFGLANSGPLKNDRIRNSRVVRIADLLADLPVSIYLSSVNTADPMLRQIIVDYECFGNDARLVSRGVRERPIAQIIYSHVLSHCMFNSIVGHLAARGGDAAFAVFIDDWSIPENDTDISLEYRATSLYKEILRNGADYAKGRLVSIAPLERLTKDSSRKRFVDVVASTFSRAYLATNNPRYSRYAVDVLQGCGRASCSDTTQDLIHLMMTMMERGPGEG